MNTKSYFEKGRRVPTATRAAKITKKLHLPELGLIQLAIHQASMTLRK